MTTPCRVKKWDNIHRTCSGYSCLQPSSSCKHEAAFLWVYCTADLALWALTPKKGFSLMLCGWTSTLVYYIFLMGTALYATAQDRRSYVPCYICHYLICYYLYWRGLSPESSGVSSMNTCSNELLQQWEFCSCQRSSPRLSPGRWLIASTLPFSRSLSPCNYQLFLSLKRPVCKFSYE